MLPSVTDRDNESQKIRVVILDDHPVVLEGLQRVIKEVNDIDLVGTATNTRDVMEKVKTLSPHVVLLDVVLHGTESGIEVAKLLSENHPHVRTIIFTNDRSNVNELLTLSLEFGVRGYVLKDKPLADVIAAIRNVFQGNMWIDPTLSGALLARKSSNAEVKEILTEREMVVLRCLRDGLSNKELAERLNISDKTVGTHLHNIYEKIGVNSRSQAIIWANRHGLT